MICCCYISPLTRGDMASMSGLTVHAPLSPPTARVARWGQYDDVLIISIIQQRRDIRSRYRRPSLLAFIAAVPLVSPSSSTRAALYLDGLGRPTGGCDQTLESAQHKRHKNFRAFVPVRVLLTRFGRAETYYSCRYSYSSYRSHPPIMEVFSFELVVRFPEIAQASSSLLGCCNHHHHQILVLVRVPVRILPAPSHASGEPNSAKAQNILP